MSERVKNLTAIGVIVASLAVAVVVLASSPPSDADRVHHLATVLKCPICTNESIASSPADLARELLVVIEERVADGWTDDEIVDFFVATYGDDVLLDPPSGGRTALLWVLPLLAAGAGVAVVITRRRIGAIPALDDADRQRVQAALRDRKAQ
ncbi:MAG: cytochrome c-type biogenesis protein [Actinomycetota bacterium]